ncbi:MAG: DUF835 domain-containing protein [Candidatus Methanoperedens sp.]|nr:DUF835 domain-containing protein [Candidatus Methanoperedens sp.]
MNGVIFSVIISLFTIFLYTALGIYVLKKNPHERTNQIFALLMLAFIIWSVGTYNTGLAAGTESLKDVLLYTKLQLSGTIIALTLFVLFTISLMNIEKVYKNPISYLIIIPAIYLLSLIWTSDASGLDTAMFSTMKERMQEFFLVSGLLGIAGVYLLLRHYMTSKYRQQEQAKIILTGAISAVLIAVISNLILPMFYGIYLLPLSTLAPAVMGVFFAYAVYQYGFCITPMPEVSVTSFCGVECTRCAEYINDKCPGCKFNREKYTDCEIYKCMTKRGYKDCGECPEISTCLLRKEISGQCFVLVPKPDSSPAIRKYDLRPGSTYFVKDTGYDLFLDAVKSGAYGFVVSTMHPQEIREKYGLCTTPIVWISDEAFDMGIKPKDLKRLSIVIINFMKKTNNAVVFLDGIDMLISINGFGNVQPVVQVMSSAAQTTNNSLIISTNMEGDALSRLKPLFFRRKRTNNNASAFKLEEKL